jgi:hypothetical protein
MVFFVHATILAVGISIVVWFYANGVIGKVWLEKIDTWP